MITKTGQSRAGRAALPAWTARKRREKEAGGGGGGAGTWGNQQTNKSHGWVEWECRGALTLGSGAGGNQPVHPVGPPHSPAVVTLILAFLALLVNVCPGRGGGVWGSAGADLVGQGGGSLFWVCLGLFGGQHVGRPWSHHWAPCTLGTQQSAQAWAGPWPAGRSGGAPTPFLASRHCSDQSPCRRPPPAWPPTTSKRRVFAGKKSEQLAAWADWALRVARTSARGLGHTRRSIAISGAKRAGRREAGRPAR